MLNISKLIFVFSILLFFGCKQETLPEKTGEQNRILQLGENNPEKLIELIKNFSEHCRAVRQNQVGSRDEFPDEFTEDGLSLLEATIQYNFMDTKEGIEDVKTTKLVLSIDKATIDKLSSAGLFAAYNAIRAKALEEIDIDANSVLLTVDCAVTSENSTKTDIEATIVSGLKTPPLPCGVQTNDYWRVTKGEGKCDGTYEGKDAAWRAAQILNLSYCQASPCNANQQWQPWWLTQVNIPYTFNTSSILNMYWPDFVSFPSGGFTCLDPTKMQQLTNALKNIKTNYLQQYFPVGSGYRFFGLSVQANGILNGDIPYTFYDGIMLYGRGTCITLPGGEIPRDE
jgi:hypothetical protein